MQFFQPKDAVNQPIALDALLINTEQLKRKLRRCMSARLMKFLHKLMQHKIKTYLASFCTKISKMTRSRVKYL